MDWMPYFAAVCGFSLTLGLTPLPLGPGEPAIPSSAGAMLRQGPHHSAQKSTTTGLVAFNTSDANVLSETLPTAMGSSFRFSERVQNLWMRGASVKANSRRGEGGKGGIHACRGNLHERRNIRPYESGANCFPWIEQCQRAAIKRKLRDIGLRHFLKPRRSRSIRLE